MNSLKQTTKRISSLSTILQHTNNVFTSSPIAAKLATDNNKDIPLSYYQKPLPKHLIALSSKEGKDHFKNSMKSGYTEAYFNTVGHFSFQSEPAFCGVSSLVMCLNALGIDPLKQWKGVWRWYDEGVVLEEACIPTEYILKNGVTFDQFHCISKRHCKVQSQRGDNLDLEKFRLDIKRVCSSQNESLVLNFYRKTLGQTGTGHFSPIAAYDPITDKVLVLDMARFKYPPFFVDLKLLFDSMLSLDSTTNQTRGYFLLKKKETFLDTRFFDCKLKCFNKLSI
ncbi:Phytochelatin-domain-containing protein [Neoconidiobolus thromboides FSU 785]|nr:Phytochelatin-domain-containing protein [Neoconidiobolus thromboides FSU 785]